jgi:hypothetical protein
MAKGEIVFDSAAISDSEAVRGERAARTLVHGCDDQRWAEAQRPRRTSAVRRLIMAARYAWRRASSRSEGTARSRAPARCALPAQRTRAHLYTAK